MDEDELAEVLDPTPDIAGLFMHYNHLYFGDSLGACNVEWSSNRMTLCAGVCEFQKLGGCRIKLSAPLLKYRPRRDLKTTLLHEMIHAYMFLEGIRDRDDHGPKFQAKMHEINRSMLQDPQRPSVGYNITVFHSFTDEVDLYRQHHWTCNRCGNLVKRAMNRPPQEADCRGARSAACTDTRCSYHMHIKHCGGTYVKTKSPENSSATAPKARTSSRSGVMNGGRDTGAAAGTSNRGGHGANASGHGSGGGLSAAAGRGGGGGGGPTASTSSRGGRSGGASGTSSAALPPVAPRGVRPISDYFTKRTGKDGAQDDSNSLATPGTRPTPSGSGPRAGTSAPAAATAARATATAAAPAAAAAPRRASAGLDALPSAEPVIVPPADVACAVGTKRPGGLVDDHAAELDAPESQEEKRRRCREAALSRFADGSRTTTVVQHKTTDVAVSRPPTAAAFVTPAAASAAMSGATAAAATAVAAPGATAAPVRARSMGRSDDPIVLSDDVDDDVDPYDGVHGGSLAGRTSQVPAGRVGLSAGHLAQPAVSFSCPVCCTQWAAGSITMDELDAHVDACLAGSF